MVTKFHFCLSVLMPMFTKSARGGPVLVLEGFRFHPHKKRKLGVLNKIRWQCAMHRIGCSAAVHTVDNEMIACRNTHNHAPPRFPTL